MRSYTGKPSTAGVALRYLVAAAEPDGGQPEAAEDQAEPVHRRDHDPGGDHGHLQHGPADQCPALPGPAHQARDDQRGHAKHAADHAGLRRLGVGDRDGHRDGQPDHHHLEDQHGRAQPPHGRASPPTSAPAGGPAAPRRSRASPAVVVDPVIRMPAPPGPAASAASSASVVAMSMASSSRGAMNTRSGPNTRAAEFLVTTRLEVAGSSSPSMPATSLSALTASTAIRASKPNASVTAAMLTAMPAGLCAESTITTGLRRSTSSRPGAVIAANACLTSSSSSGPAAEKASTAARAQTAFCAWCAPNNGSSRSE